MNIPLEAIKHSMTKDGVNPDMLDCDPNAPAPKLKPKVVTPAPSKKKAADPNEPKLKDDPKYAKFFKMLESIATTTHHTRQGIIGHDHRQTGLFLQ